jgi:UDP-N-acetylglucosamine 2-epimerase (non-hydrolysing)
MRNLLVVVAARPNFVKVAPILSAFAGHPSVGCQVLHTGQHYDRLMSASFLEQLSFPEASFQLGVGSGTHAEQTAAVMIGVEQVLQRHPFDAVLVAGDVNSTMAAAVAAAKLGVPVIHLESGLRSRDRTMPEEINRVITDRISDLLLCHCDDAVTNLVAEGVARERIAMVGNTMIDSLLALLPLARATDAVARHGLRAGEYVLVTLHRPALVDVPDRLNAVIEVLAELANTLTVVFALHPRTRARLRSEPSPLLDRLQVHDPLEYLEFVDLQASARLVVTDSGGVQEETSALGVPCVTYRTTTERPVTISLGTNRLVGVDPAALLAACEESLADPVPGGRSSRIPLWDGQAGGRAAEAITGFLDSLPAPRTAALPEAGST